MKIPAFAEPLERLIRLRAPRRDNTVDLRVHYELRREGDCSIYSIITIEDIE